MNPVIAYYDALATRYDHDRFSNSYGRHIDALERAVLRGWLAGQRLAGCVDFGCGTGRLLDFAGTGVDASLPMLQVAAGKHPTRHLLAASLDAVPLAPASMQVGFCFHVLMHLSAQEIRTFLAEAARIVQPGGRLIVDIPSAWRRRLSRRPRSGWHGDTAADAATLLAWAQPWWQAGRRHGLLVLPLHRVPQRLRPWMGGVDRFLGRILPVCCGSYQILELERAA